MSRDKQIDEMAKAVTRSICWCNEEIPTVDGMGTAITLYNNGYRKASDVAEDIFEEIEKFMSPYRYPIIAELKKKYTEGGKCKTTCQKR